MDLMEKDGNEYEETSVGNRSYPIMWLNHVIFEDDSAAGRLLIRPCRAHIHSGRTPSQALP